MCGTCQEVCPNEVHLIKDGKHFLQRENCRSCGSCVRLCPSSPPGYGFGGALVLPDFLARPEELFNRLHPQLDLLRGIGGLTVSGGEPLIQHRQIHDLLKLCREDNIHTAVETSGSLPRGHFEVMLEVVDCWLFGLRPVPEDVASAYRVADFNQAAQNLKFLSSHGANQIIIRTPIIPGFTDNFRELSKIVELMHRNGLETIELLPYNPHTDLYYRAMGRRMPVEIAKQPSEVELLSIQDFFTKQNIKAGFAGEAKTRVDNN